MGVTSAVGSEFVVSGPFEAGVRVGGDEVRGGLSDLSLGLLRRCEPVRTPGVYQRQRHMPGRWFSTTAGRFLEYESLLERDWMLLMDFDREVEWICEQPLRLRYVKDGRPASHVPDLLVWRRGVPELCDVKSEERVDDPTFRAQVEATGVACAEAGIGYRVLSEPDRQLLANVRWLAGFRERPPDPDGERARMLAMAGGGVVHDRGAAVRRARADARPAGVDELAVGGRCAGRRVGADRRGQPCVRAVAGGGMTVGRWPLSVGGRLMIDGEAITVTAVDGAEVRGFTGRGEPVRFVLTRVEGEPSAAPGNEEWRFGPVLLDAGALERSAAARGGGAVGASERGVVRLSLRGSRPSRCRGSRVQRFDPARTTLGDRLEAKAAELGCSVETLRKRRR